MNQYTRISKAEYFTIAQKSKFRAMSSPSFRHFHEPFPTHLHCVSEFASDDDTTPLCSFIQRGPKVIFYKGQPIWSDWLRQTQTPTIKLDKEPIPIAEQCDSELLKVIRKYEAREILQPTD